MSIIRRLEQLQWFPIESVGTLQCFIRLYPPPSSKHTSGTAISPCTTNNTHESFEHKFNSAIKPVGIDMIYFVLSQRMLFGSFEWKFNLRTMDILSTHSCLNWDTLVLKQFHEFCLVVEHQRDLGLLNFKRAGWNGCVYQGGVLGCITVY